MSIDNFAISLCFCLLNPLLCATLPLTLGKGQYTIRGCARVHACTCIIYRNCKETVTNMSKSHGLDFNVKQFVCMCVENQATCGCFLQEYVRLVRS